MGTPVSKSANPHYKSFSIPRCIILAITLSLTAAVSLLWLFT